MGSAQTQGRLWSQAVRDWVEVCEPMSEPLHEATLAALAPLSGLALLDVGCGSGSVLSTAARHGAHVSGLDAATAMIAVARDRMPDADLHVGDMEEMPFADATFDVVTAFNAVQFADAPPVALDEMVRVTRPGGRVAILEFSRPRNRLFGRLYSFYFRHVLPRVGQWCSRSPDSAYHYLPASVLAFPDYEELLRRMEAHGLADTRYYPFTFGIATLYVGVKK